MPTLVWRYRTALRDYHGSASWVAWADALETVAHDRLTRGLQGHGSGPTRPARALHTLCAWARGSRILDDPVSPQPFATAIEGRAGVFSGHERTPVDGLSLLWLVWPNGRLRLPLGMRLGRKGGPATSDWALERLSDARNRLRCHPDAVVLAAWDPSRALLKRMRDDGGSVVCRLRQNRLCTTRPLRTDRRYPHGAERGWLSGGLNGLVVRHGNKDYATQRLPLAAAAVRQRSRLRSPRPEWRSSPLRASAAASRHPLVGCLWRAGVRTTGAAA